MKERGYAELRHGIPDEQIDEVVNRYADFTLNHPDPQSETMDAMLPSFPTTKDSSNAKLYDKDGFFLWDEWMSKQLDELERSKDVQKEWHKYRTNVNGVGKPDGYTNRSFQEQALKLSRGLIIPPPPRTQRNTFTFLCDTMLAWFKTIGIMDGVVFLQRQSS